MKWNEFFRQYILSFSLFGSITVLVLVSVVLIDIYSGVFDKSLLSTHTSPSEIHSDPASPDSTSPDLELNITPNSNPETSDFKSETSDSRSTFDHSNYSSFIISISGLVPQTTPLSPDDLHGDLYLGHLFYPEPNQNSLMLIASYGQGSYQRFEFLHVEAGIALMQMISAARDEGIWIVPTSAFRNFERQERLFNRQVERYGSAEDAAFVSAPPGYSEHHTGYAVDLADGYRSVEDFSSDFANTSAYRWLQQNAFKFGFELSFPPENKMGISFEPWHWRFIGSVNAENLFVRAKSRE